MKSYLGGGLAGYTYHPMGSFHRRAMPIRSGVQGYVRRLNGVAQIAAPAGAKPYGTGSLSAVRKNGAFDWQGVYDASVYE